MYLKLGRKSKYIHLYVFIAHLLIKENSLFAQMVLLYKEREHAREFVFLKKNTAKIINMVSVRVSSDVSWRGRKTVERDCSCVCLKVYMTV